MFCRFDHEQVTSNCYMSNPRIIQLLQRVIEKELVRSRSCATLVEISIQIHQMLLTGFNNASSLNYIILISRYLVALKA